MKMVEGKGFSLIEVLIVLGVLGILAIVFTT
jgi:prepilin-type N-terminal cleavage/methylation domain-containing protein